MLRSHERGEISRLLACRADLKLNKSWYFTGMVLQDVAVHDSARSVTVSACALSACCFHVIRIFGHIYVHGKKDFDL